MIVTIATVATVATVATAETLVISYINATLNKFSFEFNAISSAEIYYSAPVAVLNKHCMLAHFAARILRTHTHA